MYSNGPSRMQRVQVQFQRFRSLQLFLERSIPIATSALTLVNVSRILALSSLGTQEIACLPPIPFPLIKTPSACVEAAVDLAFRT